jgi:transcriptional regulator with XRE-family HTH domain
LDAQAQFGTTVRRLRKAAGLTQEQLGARADMDLSAVSRLERGHRNPRLDTLVRIAKALDVPPATLLEDVR